VKIKLRGQRNLFTVLFGQTPMTPDGNTQPQSVPRGSNLNPVFFHLVVQGVASASEGGGDLGYIASAPE